MMRRSVCVAQDEFERLAGPVKTAQNNAKLANQAYTAAELKLAKAETTAERLGNNPKLQKEAMARIHKLQEAARRMDELFCRGVWGSGVRAGCPLASAVAFPPCLSLSLRSLSLSRVRSHPRCLAPHILSPPPDRSSRRTRTSSVRSGTGARSRA
eukprot:126260-Rhodomonas_salina.5